MDLQVSTETSNSRDLSWLASSFAVNHAKPRTVLIASADEDTHYPDGYIKPGVILAQYTSGANSGLWAPYVSDDTVGEGLGDPAGIVLDGFRIRKDADGSVIGTKTAGAVILSGQPIRVVLDKLPGLLLEDGTTAYAPVAADLTALGFNQDAEL